MYSYYSYNKGAIPMFKNVGREFFEWGKLICKTGIIFSFTAKNGHGGTVPQKYYLAVYFFFSTLINLLCAGFLH